MNACVGGGGGECRYTECVSNPEDDMSLSDLGDDCCCVDDSQCASDDCEPTEKYCKPGLCEDDSFVQMLISSNPVGAGLEPTRGAAAFPLPFFSLSPREFESRRCRPSPATSGTTR